MPRNPVAEQQLEEQLKRIEHNIGELEKGNQGAAGVWSGFESVASGDIRVQTPGAKEGSLLFLTNHLQDIANEFYRTDGSGNVFSGFLITSPYIPGEPRAYSWLIIAKEYYV